MVFADHLGVPSISYGFNGPCMRLFLFICVIGVGCRRRVSLDLRQLHLVASVSINMCSLLCVCGRMDKFGDPNFLYHRLSAQLFGVLAITIADSPIVPLNYTDFTTGLKRALLLRSLFV